MFATLSVYSAHQDIAFQTLLYILVPAFYLWLYSQTPGYRRYKAQKEQASPKISLVELPAVQQDEPIANPVIEELEDVWGETEGEVEPENLPTEDLETEISEDVKPTDLQPEAQAEAVSEKEIEQILTTRWQPYKGNAKRSQFRKLCQTLQIQGYSKLQGLGAFSKFLKEHNLSREHLIRTLDQIQSA